MWRSTPATTSAGGAEATLLEFSEWGGDGESDHVEQYRQWGVEGFSEHYAFSWDAVEAEARARADEYVAWVQSQTKTAPG